MFEVLKLAIGMIKELISFDGKCGKQQSAVFLFYGGNPFWQRGNMDKNVPAFFAAEKGVVFLSVSNFWGGR